MYHNFNVTGHKRAANMTLITGTLIWIIVFGALFLISDTAAAALPRFIIPALFLGIAFGAYKQFQEPIVNEAKS